MRSFQGEKRNPTRRGISADFLRRGISADFLRRGISADFLPRKIPRLRGLIKRAHSNAGGWSAERASESPSFRRAAAIFFFALLYLLALYAAPPLFGETILIAVQESLNGGSVPSPSPAKEGILAGIFDRGHIIFDLPESVPLPPLEELVRMAREGGAALVLDVVVEFRESRLSDGQLRIDASGRYSVIDVSAGTMRKEGDIAGTNQGRERNVDRNALGMELGDQVAEDTDALLRHVVNGREK
jgi:hypothetical protein